MKSVRIWDSEKSNFGGFVDLEVVQGKILSLKAAVPTVQPKYLLPGFCDASVTLGSNARGGKTGREEIATYLSGFLAAGFSHIESVGDPNLSNLQSEITKSKWLSPVITQSQKPALYAELAIGKETLYHSGLTFSPDSKRNRHIPIFLKEVENRGFSQTELFAKRREGEEKGYLPVAYTFADKTSWEDALDTGFPVIFHPMPEGTNLYRAQKRDFRWAPMLSILYLQELKTNPELRKEEVPIWSRLHSVFGSRWKDSLSWEDEEESSETISFSQYKSTFQAEAEVGKNLLFASGSGHWGLFPGQAAIVEVRLWETLLAKPEERKVELVKEKPGFWASLFGNFSPGLLPTNRDPESISQIRREIIQTLTVRTCSFIGADHEGKIRVGGPAHFSIHDENPLKRSSGIFPIESMILGGKLVYTPKPTKEGTAK
ncbi:hypothetical protein ND861_16195 [Leptospira sp. 2 VSF19]|uniref:Amidohydrolase n=2 Tax=Leptospira soteropolitanensis TaxID=2950025 RepID=A0AAW5VIX7_9LEPT|nr:hypothetical protein [Leptospira soteropolitanensis]MCW7501838.1 hypothetical protein [Leptospira soteropolitanensis]MCW7524033.1 hypothetical protein [Leptospira soteropolitanensis]MCW7527898.1 hypothetical protein [Leptospira soteropolitanensis]MCW7531808.1 hypothetical protein [Leptospira soteropolitanensis]